MDNTITGVIMYHPINAIKKTVECKNCGKQFPQYNRRIYCSVSCYWQYRRNHPGEYLTEERTVLICANCGKQFNRRKHEVQSIESFCSRKCAGNITGHHPKRDRKDWLPSIIKYCEQCGKEFKTHGRRYNQRFCCRKCFDENRSKYGWGDNNSNYRHGQNPNVAKPTAARHFQMKCIICGFDNFVTVHHITPRSEGGTNIPSNLAVLCPNHHILADKDIISREELQNIVNKLLTI